MIKKLHQVSSALKVAIFCMTHVKAMAQYMSFGQSIPVQAISIGLAMTRLHPRKSYFWPPARFEPCRLSNDMVPRRP